MEIFTKIVDFIQPLTIFAKHFILDVLQVYEYASDKTKQNPGHLFHKNLGLQSLQISFTFKFNFIFTLLPCGETLLITNSIQVSLISNFFTIHLNTYDINQPVFICSNSSDNNYRLTFSNLLGENKEIQSELHSIVLPW